MRESSQHIAALKQGKNWLNKMLTVGIILAKTMTIIILNIFEKAFMEF